MGKIQVLDCTLRDGGYVNDFAFTKRGIQDIIHKLAMAHIDIIECGFLKDCVYNKNKTLFSGVHLITPFIGNKKPGVMYVAMIAIGDIDAEKIARRTEKTIDGIRITFHKHEIEEAFLLGGELMDKGYEVFIQPVGTTSYSDMELLELVERVNELNPYAFYLVDTLGKMYANQLLHLFHLVDRNLREDIRIGYHSHNNLQLAFSNSQELIKNSGEREVILDSSILGMGRGAGNLCTEIITKYINDNIGYSYESNILLEIVDNYINPISYIYPWGYTASYFIAAANDCHPNYVSYLMKKQTLNISSIDKILKSLPIEKRDIFDHEFIEKCYLSYQHNQVDDHEILKEIKKIIKNKRVLILAPGRTLKTKEEDIMKAIKKNTFVISVNCIPKDYNPDMIFISNRKRFQGIDQLDSMKKSEIPVVITSNIVENKEEEDYFWTINYSDYLVEDHGLEDNACLMLMQLLIKLGKDKVKIAGFDGYQTNIEKNYYRHDMINGTNQENLLKMNKRIKNYMKKITTQLEVDFITPSVYAS